MSNALSPSAVRTFHIVMLFVAAAMVIGATVFSAAAINDLRSSIGWVTHALNVKAKVSDVLAANQNADAQYLRYLLTQDIEYWQNHMNSLPQLDRELAGLHAQVADNPEQSQQVESLQRLVTERNQLFAEAMRRVDSDGLAASMPYLRQGRVAAHNLEVRNKAMQIERAETLLLQQRQSELEAVLVQSTTTVFLVNALALLISVIALFSLSRSSRQRLQQQLMQVRAEEAESASRQKSEFLASMSHEIRTPMNAVFGFTQLLAKTTIEPRAREYLKAIQTSGKALLALINDILDLSKIEAGKLSLNLQNTNVRDLADSSVGVFLEAAEREGLQLRMAVEPDVPRVVYIDPHRTRQVLMNLLSNAVKYTERGGIRLKVSAENISEERCDLLFAVRDTGVGLSSSQQQSLFEPFYRASEDSDAPTGTGLGLAIVRKLLIAMNGQVDVVSEPGVGSTFTARLYNVPISGKEADSLDEDADVHFGTLAKSRILIVDDVSWNRDLLAAFLSEGDHELAFAEDGERAIEVAQAFVPDVVLMDLRMPKLDGRSATRRLRGIDALSQVRVVAVSASSNSRDEGSIEHDFEGFVRKPISREKLFDVLSEQIGPRGADTAHPVEEEIQSLPASSAAPDSALHAAALARLERIVDAELEAMATTLRVGEVRHLANELHGLGQEVGERRLVYFAERLRSAVERFDVLQMESLLQQLPEHMPDPIRSKRSDP